MIVYQLTTRGTALYICRASCFRWIGRYLQPSKSQIHVAPHVLGWLESICNLVLGKGSQNVMSWHVIRSQDLVHWSNNTTRKQGNSPKLSYTTTREHGNSPKLRVPTLPTLSPTKPRAVVSQSISQSKPRAGFQSIIEYRFVDYGLLVFGHRIPVCWLCVISSCSLNTSLLIMGYWISIINYRITSYRLSPTTNRCSQFRTNLSEGSSSIIGYQLSVINDGQSLLAVQWQPKWRLLSRLTPTEVAVVDS